LVNASLNWASIVGIVLAVGGAFLYFVRNFKPALARDYDVFFAAVGLLCGGILIFQGWRLDPILQFGQFLLAGSTVFFAYESVRLRGVTTEQARRSSYFDEEEPAPFRPRGGLGGSPDWDRDRERFDRPEPIRRRIGSQDEEDDFYRPRRPSRVAIPERAASRRTPSEDWDRPSREPAAEPTPRPSRGRPSNWDEPSETADRGIGPRWSAGAARTEAPPFGARRRERESGPEQRRGSRPTPSSEPLPRSSRRPSEAADPGRSRPPGSAPGSTPPGIPQGTPIARGGSDSPAVRDADFSPLEENRSSGPARPSSGSTTPPRDNSSRFDD
jgi:hypothetical protein